MHCALLHPQDLGQIVASVGRRPVIVAHNIGDKTLLPWLNKENEDEGYVYDSGFMLCAFDSMPEAIDCFVSIRRCIAYIFDEHGRPIEWRGLYDDRNSLLHDPLTD